MLQTLLAGLSGNPAALSRDVGLGFQASTWTWIPRHSPACASELRKSTKHLTNQEPGFEDQRNLNHFYKLRGSAHDELSILTPFSLLDLPGTPPVSGCLNKQGARL